MPPPATRTLLATLGDAAFLACSWTWCIGMFLPVLLLRDLGRNSWFAFAIPNVLGAAAMAWWFSSPERSRAFVQRHATAIRWFSLVTLTYQWFFATWILRGIGLSLNSVLVVAAFVAIFFLVPTLLANDSRRRLASLATLLASGACIAAWAIMHPTEPRLTDLPSAQLPSSHLAPLAAVCALGFLTCPLLDRTFHLTLERAPKPKLAFTLGFVLLFTPLIATTLHYGAELIRDAAQTKRTLAPGGAHWFVIAHMAVQLAFTIAVHERSLRAAKSSIDMMPSEPSTIGASLLGMALAIAPMFLSTRITPDMANIEVVYRLLLACYGLLFPLYILACAVPLGRHAPGLSNPRLTAMAITAALATPFYWEGFIARKTEWLFAGVAIVLVFSVLTRLVAPGPRGPGAPSPVPAPHP